MPAFVAKIDLILLPSNLSKDVRNPPKDLSDQPTNKQNTQHIHTRTCTPVFPSALFTTATNGNYPVATNCHTHSTGYM